MPPYPTSAAAAIAALHRRYRPAYAPRAVVDRLHSESEAAMKVASVQERLAKVGSEDMPMSVEQFAKFFRDDVLTTTKLMQQIGIKPSE